MYGWELRPSKMRWELTMKVIWSFCLAVQLLFSISCTVVILNYIVYTYPWYGFDLFQDIGGCDIQKQEIREAVELPLTHHELYKQIGIDPPRGVLVYGPPGTGKTMLVKAVANHTNAAFIRVVGSSEFVQKYLGEVWIRYLQLNWC